MTHGRRKSAFPVGTPSCFAFAGEAIESDGYPGPEKAGPMRRSRAVPAAHVPSELDTFPRLLLHHAQLRGARPATREKDLGIWQTWTGRRSPTRCARWPAGWRHWASSAG